MNVTEILRTLDSEITRLQRARDLLAGGGGDAVGTPKKRRPMSAETRARIAEAQRKRWAAVKKT